MESAVVDTAAQGKGTLMKRAWQAVVLSARYGAVMLVLSALAMGDAGVLIPSGRTQPDPSLLSLEEMRIDIHIDNGDAHVSVREIFANHTGGNQEGNYVFALPSRATVSDFAVWDGLTRIPAIVLERRRAEEIYNAIKQQQVDPGLLQQGEQTAGEARHTAAFSAKIFPIAAYGTKRMEIEYHESIPVESLKSQFAIPLRPDAYRGLTAGKLSIHFELSSAHAIKEFVVGSKTLPMKISERDAHTVKGSFEGSNVAFTEDFTVRYSLDASQSDTLAVITHREPESGAPSPDEIAPVRSKNEPGFFEAQALIGAGANSAPGASPSAAGAARAGKTVIVLFDTSLSMQWEKLERSFDAMQTLTRSLQPSDKFNLVLFNSDVNLYAPAPAAWNAAEAAKSLEFVKASRLRGGTNLEKALSTALEQCKQASGEPYLVIFTDGGVTRGTIGSGKLSKWYQSQWQALAETGRPRTMVFAVGDDANLQLLKMLARNEGVLENVRSTEPLEFKLQAFLSKIGRNPVGQLRMESSPQGAVDYVYPLQDNAYGGSVASWVGQYKKASDKVDFTVRGVRDGQAFSASASAALPEKEPGHPQLPRLWARARVDALLEKIEREGEDRASIDEIIRLARKYKFVTPYTSFLAVPRSLLRPRVIRPGDPVLRVKTDPAIASVVALFPFGLVKQLRYLPQEDIWQTRFLAPTDMNDGTYSVRLVLRDHDGNVYREAKSFVIASKPPVVKARLDRAQVRVGELVKMKVAASELTRTVTARLAGADAVQLHWDPSAGANTGDLLIPSTLAPGKYVLTVTAEDVAHNIGSQEVSLEVLP
jgi:Ca-activated chloride channel homolog